MGRTKIDGTSIFKVSLRNPIFSMYQLVSIFRFFGILVAIELVAPCYSLLLPTV